MADTREAPLYRVLGLLDKVRKQGAGWVASCPGPVHGEGGDRHPSLSVSTGYDGRVLLKCRAGCATDDVLAALSLSYGDLWEKSATGIPIRRYRLLNQQGKVVGEHVRTGDGKEKSVHWEHDGQNGLGGVSTADLPLYRMPDVLTADPSLPVIMTEGEKAADAAASLGYVAVGTVTGASGTPSEDVLSVLAGREVWLWPDNDDPGRGHMARIATRLKGPVRLVRWDAAPDGGDAADYVDQGGTADGVRTMATASADALPPDVVAVATTSGPRIWTATELAATRFMPPKWAIPGLLPSGLAILAGRPKLGKSWLGLGWAIDIAIGGRVLRSMDAPQGETLYLGLEDGPRRMQERMVLMLGDAAVPAGMHIATDWPRTNEGGIDHLGEWLTQHKATRLVVVDTFKRIRPIEKNSQRLYDLDYDAMQPMAQLAQEFNVAIVVVFHTRKGEGTDPLEMVSGTLGLSGAADAVLVLRRERGQADASLFVTGRDVEEQDLALRWEKDDVLGWSLLGDAAQFRTSRERGDILRILDQMPGSRPSDVAGALGRKVGNIRYLLFAMTRDGEVRARDGLYYPLTTTPNVANAPITPNPLTNANGRAHVSDVRGIRAVRGVSGVSDDGQDAEGEIPW